MACPDIRITPTGKSFPGDTHRWFADISKIRETRVRTRSGSPWRAPAHHRVAARDAEQRGGPAMIGVRDEVAYVLPGKLGGVYNYVRNLLAHRRDDRLSYASVRTDNASDADIRCSEPMPGDRDVRFAYSLPPENIHSVLRRFARAFNGPGVIVANDWIELALTAIHDTGRAVVAITHGDFDYYYDLALRHRETIDAYVTYSNRMFERLREILPDRHDAIFLLPYGVDIPAEVGVRPAARCGCSMSDA